MATVHLEGDPFLPQTRVNQMKSLLQKIAARQQQLRTSCGSPLVICGDFNCGVTSAVYRLLASGTLSADFLEHGRSCVEDGKASIEHPFKLSDCFSSATVDQEKPSPASAPLFTYSLSSSAETNNDLLDFVWHTPSLRCTGLAVGISVAEKAGEGEEEKEKKEAVTTPGGDDLGLADSGTNAAVRLSSAAWSRRFRTDYEDLQGVLQRGKGLPDATHPSDHLPVIAQFQFV